MIKIDDDMKTAINNALATNSPCVVATASPEGHPGIGYRGSVLVFEDDTLAYWERTMRTGLDHIEANPLIVIMYRNPVRRQAWKFFGRATVHRKGNIRKRVMNRVAPQELDRDPDRTGYAVTVKIDSIELMNGEIIQTRQNN